MKIVPKNFLGNELSGNIFDLGFGSTSKKKSNKDKRRTFTQTQRKEILHRQDMKCAKCKGKLDPRDIEYDHKKSWASGGKTEIDNGRALCGSCHNKLTHKKILNKVDKPKKTKSKENDPFGFNEFKPPKLDFF